MDGIIADVSELSKTEDSIISPVKEKLDLVALANEAAVKYTDSLNEKEISFTSEGSFTVKTGRTLYGRPCHWLYPSHY